MSKVRILLLAIALLMLIVLNITSKYSRNLTYAIITVSISIFLTFIIPESEMDLQKHYYTLELFRTYGYDSTVADYPWLFSTLPVYAMLFYSVSMLGINQIILFLASLTVYGVQFYVLSMVRKDYRLDKKSEIILSTMVLMLTNAYFITTIRNIMAFALFYLFLYLDLVRKQRIKCIFCYILLCLYHDSCIVLLAIRLMIGIFNTTSLKKIAIIILFWPLMLDLLSAVFIKSSIPFFVNIANKILVYVAEGANDMWIGGIGNHMMIALQLTFILYISYRIFKDKPSIKKYELFYNIITLFVIGGISNLAIVFRFIPMCMFFIPALIYIHGLHRNDFVLQFNYRKRLGVINFLTLSIFLSLILLQYRYSSFGIQAYLN